MSGTEGYTPNIIVERDYNGYFEALVRALCKRKTTPWKCDTIVISSGPFRVDAVTCWHERDNSRMLHIDFYSSIRGSYGGLSNEDANSIVDKWF